MHRSPRPTRVAAVLGGLAGIALAAGPASAHVTAAPDEVGAGAFAAITLTVPHGCEGSPTRSIAVAIPDGVLGVKPQVHPGWTATVEREQLPEPVEGRHGEQLTERVSVVTFTAQPGNELPDDMRDQFVIGYQAPDTTGETLLFKTVQTCVTGETAWVEESDDEGEEPEHPAPAVRVVPADDGTAARPVAPVAGEDEDEDGDSTQMATAGLVAGLLGALTGAASLVRTRRRR